MLFVSFVEIIILFEYIPNIIRDVTSTNKYDLGASVYVSLKFHC